MKGFAIVIIVTFLIRLCSVFIDQYILVKEFLLIRNSFNMRVIFDNLTLVVKIVQKDKYLIKFRFEIV